MGETLQDSRNFCNQFMRGAPQMQEVLKDNHIRTIKDVAAILRCSKTHVSQVLAGKIPGIPRLTHIAMGRRKLVWRDWLDQQPETASLARVYHKRIASQWSSIMPARSSVIG